jgi:hypothetical protein
VLNGMLVGTEAEEDVSESECVGMVGTSSVDGIIVERMSAWGFSMCRREAHPLQLRVRRPARRLAIRPVFEECHRAP